MSVESINNKIDLVIGYKADIKTALQEQDSSISDSTLLAEYADKIRAMTLVEGDTATEINELRNQISLLTTENTSLTNQVGTLNSEKSSLQEQINTISTENTALQSQVTTLSDENSELQSQVDTLTIEKNDLSNRLAVAEQKTNTILGVEG